MVVYTCSYTYVCVWGGGSMSLHGYTCVVYTCACGRGGVRMRLYMEGGESVKNFSNSRDLHMATDAIISQTMFA